MSFKLPPEVTVKSEKYGNKHAYILRHEKLGELGRLVLSEYMGQTHFSHEVVGNENDPLTQKRREILEPITKAMVFEVEKNLGKRGANITPPPQNYSHGVPPKGQTVEVQLLPCIKCNAKVAHIIYSHASTPGEIEDYYRMMFSKLSEFNMPTWVVGIENRTTGDVLVLKAWPERTESAKWTNGNKFDAMIRQLQSSHCSKEKNRDYN